jgi:hypothetical protein
MLERFKLIREQPNRPILAKCYLSDGRTFFFFLSPDISEKRIKEMIPMLVDRELHGDGTSSKKKRRRTKA